MLLLYGCETVPADWQVEESTPPSYSRVYYVLSGEVQYTDEYQSRQLRAGHMYAFPSTRLYRMRQNPEKPLHCLFLHIDIFPHLLHELLELQVEAGSFLYHLFGSMSLWCTECPGHGESPVMEALSNGLTAWLDSHGYLTGVPARLADTLQYITEHVKDKITVEELSRLCGYHPQYYIRLFNACLGITPYQYIINYRMKLGFYSLLNGCSVAEAAQRSGYTEVRNFIRSFKKQYGYPPLQIRKMIHIVP